MIESEITPQPKPLLVPRNSRLEEISRIAKYSLVKGVTLLITVAIGLYLTILIINLGGYADRVFEGMISEQLGARLLGGWLKEVKDPVERARIVEETQWEMEEAMGLHQPFFLRSVRWLARSMTLDISHTEANVMGGWEAGRIQKIVLSRLPYTLWLVGLSNLVAFLVSIRLALILSRKPGSLIDRAVILLSPVISAPSWIFGVVLLFIFAASLRILPFPIGFDATVKVDTLQSFLFMAKHMLLPGSAVLLSTVFQSIYTWRTFFLIYSHEDYVETARAKGLSSRMIEARYILRPVMPYVITNFAVMMILFWQSAIALERLFLWPGLGNLFITAVRGFNTPLTLGVVVVFAYLLAITVFLLDIFYAVLDPRVRVGSQNASLNTGYRKAKRLSKAPKIRWRPPAPGGARPAAARPGQLVRTLRERLSPYSLWASFRQNLRTMKPIFQEIARSPSAVVGLVIILVLAGSSIYIVIAYPYDRVVKNWHSHEEWTKNPVNAMPAWVNFFRSKKLPETIVLNSRETARSEPETIAEGITQVEIPFTFDYTSDALPQDILIFLDSTYQEKSPYVTISWRRPDGTLLDLGGQAIEARQTYYLSRDARLERRLKTNNILQALFIDPASASLSPLKGRYEMVLSVLHFEPQDSLEAEVILYGRVYGLAGTDNQRRDLTLALLWGAPVALAFGLLGAIGTSLVAMTIAAFGAWYSGWVDELIQRLTEINMILPTLPIAILVYFMYSKSIWVILGIVVLLNIFGSAIKNYRSIFLQARQAPYIEAAQASGASNWRIISKYLAPRILPVLIPQLVIMVPTYVFYEATLAYLGVSDPYLPTWGKTIYEALVQRGLQDYPYWVLEPLALLLLTGLAFALFGFALDRVLNPRLREE